MILDKGGKVLVGIFLVNFRGHFGEMSHSFLEKMVNSSHSGPVLRQANSLILLCSLTLQDFKCYCPKPQVTMKQNRCLLSHIKFLRQYSSKKLKWFGSEAPKPSCLVTWLCQLCLQTAKRSRY